MLIRFLIVQYFPLYVISGMVLAANTSHKKPPNKHFRSKIIAKCHFETL